MRRWPVMLCSFIVATSCGAQPEAVVVTGRQTSEPDVAAPVPTIDALPASSVTTTSEIDTTVALPSAAAEPDRLSVEDALLRPDDVGKPWEHQWSEFDAITVDPGPNQTDCEAYRVYARLHTSRAANSMWWRDGANLNHYVYRLDDAASVVDVVDTIANLSATCPVVSWNEGGSFTIERIELGTEGIAGLHMISDVGQLTSVAIASRGDLVSVLKLERWPMTGAAPVDLPVGEFAQTAALMGDRLTRAAFEMSQVPTDPPNNSSSTTTTTTTTQDFAADDLAAALLGGDDMGPEWDLAALSEYDSGAGEPFSDDCDAIVASQLIDRALVREAELVHASGASANQFIGATSSADTASALIERFADWSNCDDGALFASFSAQQIDVPGATAAAHLVARELGETAGPDVVEVVALSVGRYVSVLVLEGAANQLDLAASLPKLAERSATKIADTLD